MPNQGRKLKVAIATSGKGVILTDASQMKYNKNFSVYYY